MLQAAPPRFAFSIAARSGLARSGTIAMRRGAIATPAFMPVGTAATVKAMRPAEVRATGADIILGYTYHLMLRPGAERMARLGGLHGFMGWDRPILTDSGGYQVFSLSQLRNISEDGVQFQSHLDGSSHFLGPETAIEIQKSLGSDIMMVLDDCLAYPATHFETDKSMKRSLAWAVRCREHFRKIVDQDQALFGIVQGGIYPDLRKE